MKLKSVIISISIVILSIFMFTIAVNMLEILVKKMNEKQVVVIRGGVWE